MTPADTPRSLSQAAVQQLDAQYRSSPRYTHAPSAAPLPPMHPSRHPHTQQQEQDGAALQPRPPPSSHQPSPRSALTSPRGAELPWRALQPQPSSASLLTRPSHTHSLPDTPPARPPLPGAAPGSPRHTLLPLPQAHTTAHRHASHNTGMYQPPHTPRSEAPRNPPYPPSTPTNRPSSPSPYSPYAPPTPRSSDLDSRSHSQYLYGPGGGGGGGGGAGRGPGSSRESEASRQSVSQENKSLLRKVCRPS
jgi:hypothetical protein